ncbi:MAG: phage tail protein [Paraclostridium bifermentans]|uniref:phage tail spike protein n=1 Tax=Paraclostridium bifermentans TaxID=1490 RepID=UPI001DA0B301|nr:phage tail spike protein [Paraclostridium bifermentans]MBS6509715.1 phage tail protein [Paraclostridium bifermentans]
MLQLRNKYKKKIAGLTDYKNLTIEKDLASGDKVLAFLYPKTSKSYSDIEEECYINTKEDEFIVKEKNVQNEYTEFKCILNLEDLEGKPWERYASEEQTIDKALSLALAGTGWIVGSCSLKKKRTVRMSNCSSLDVIKEIKKTYRCDLVFNTLTKTIDVHEHLGEDKGTYFIDSLNLKNLSIQGNSYDFFTRIIPIGKDNLKISSINNGKEYVENYQYSNKVKTCHWIDERYTIVENLKEDAEAKLNEISKPYRSYAADIINLAKLNDKYKNILDYKLGDTIYLISKDNKFKDKQRIVKIIEHPDEHELDSVEISNTKLSFEETQTQFQEAADTIDNITSDNGTVIGSTVDEIETKQIKDFDSEVVRAGNITAVNAKIYNLEAHNVTVTGRLNAVEATIGTLEVNVATIDKITVTNTALINDLQANKASITQLEAINANIKILEADVGNIETLVNGNLSSKNLQAGSITARELAANAITAGSTVIGEGAIGNAQISNLDATKLNAGTIDTSLITIAGPNSNLRLSGNRLQVFIGIGSNQIERVSLGDVNGDGSVYGFRVRGADGKTILIDENGVKSEGITNGSITNDKINSNANIDGAKLNINSVVTKINGATTSILGTKIDINGTNLSLKLSQQDTTITEHKKTIDSHTTSIEANTNAIKLKVDNQTYITDKTNFTNTLNKATSDISILKGQISLKVEQSDITNAIDNIEIGGTNLLKNTSDFVNTLNWSLSKGVGQEGILEIVQDPLFGSVLHTTKPNNASWWVLGNMPTLLPKNKFTIGKKYTISFWAKATSTVVIDVNFSDSNGTNAVTGNIHFTLTDKWTRYSATFIANSEGNTPELYITSGISEHWWTKFQLEEGNKLTDYNKAQEDIINQIDTKVSTAKAEIKITTDAISQNISNLTTTVNNKADGSLVTSLSNKVSSLETSLNGIKGEVSSLETTTTTINTKADKAQSDATKGINDAKTAADKANNAQSTANTNKGNITNLTTEVTTVKSSVATLDISLKGITQRVSNTEENITTITTTSNTNKNNIASLTTEVTTVKSSVATLDVNLKGITQRVSNTETSIVSVNQLANNANNKIDSLEIGGRNLLKNSKDSLSATSSNSKQVGILSIDKNSLSGKTITISLDFNFEGLTSVSGQSNRLGYEMSITFEDGSSFYIGCWNYVSNSTKFKGRKSNTQEIPNKPIKSINYSGLYIQCNATKAYIGNPKLEFGNKNTDYTQAPEDFESQLTTTNNKVASIETNLGSITSRVSSVESTTNSINGQVNNLSNRMNTAETKITDSSIVSTVTKSSTYRTDMDSKVSYYNVVSSINQSAEQIKIIASKIDLEGATTIGDGKGNYVRIEGYGYTAYINYLQTMYMGGYMENGVRTPSLYMGASGFDANSSSYSGSYFAMKNYGSYHHIAMRSRLTGQWSIIQFNEAGDITFTPHVKCAFERPAVFRQGLEIRNEYGIDLYDWNGNLKGRISRGVFELSQIKSIDNTLIQVKDSVRCMTWGNTMGTDDGRWGTIYLLRAPDVSSDITLKENIVYTDMKTIIPRSSSLDNDNSLTYQDMYDFYKDIYRSAEYNYIGDDTTVLGIIANDIVDTKVGKKIIKRNESGKLSYLQETRISVTEGALKQAILEIEKLKEEIKQLKAS